MQEPIPEDQEKGPPLVSPVIERNDDDYQSPTKVSVRLPRAWWERLDRIAKAEEYEDGKEGRKRIVIQLVRWSMSLAQPPVRPEGSDLKDLVQSSATLAKFRWDQIKAEKKRRNLSLNEVFQAHLKRGLDQYELEKKADREAKKAD